MVTTDVSLALPATIGNLIAGGEVPARDGATFTKTSPHNSRRIVDVARSQAVDVADAVAAAAAAQPGWAATAAPARGEILFRLAALMDEHADALAAIVAAETGKAPTEARGEVGGAAALARFFAGEGTRMFGRTMPSMVATKQVTTIREPIGVAALIIAANTPIANTAWKAFPALICGNAAVLKAAEDTPATSWAFGILARAAGVPDGVLNIVHGFGDEAGRPLVADNRVDVISFTGSSAVGLEIAQVAAQRLARVSLELGGKNPLIVCDDADVERAVRWTALSAFSNAGQRCAAGSRIIVTDGIWDTFVEALLAHTATLSVGPTDDDDLGPVISQRALQRITDRLDALDAQAATILAGGHRMDDPAHADGWYLQPTVIAMSDVNHELSKVELFGPVAQIYRVDDYPAALALANDSPYGLTAAIHTRDVDRAMHFTRNVNAGVAVVNGGTYGSEPHMPFGGRKLSGNGTREPGTEALDVYSELKAVYVWVDEPTP